MHQLGTLMSQYLHCCIGGFLVYCICSFKMSSWLQIRCNFSLHVKLLSDKDVDMNEMQEYTFRARLIASIGYYTAMKTHYY